MEDLAFRRIKQICISQICSHSSRHARSVRRTWPSVVELIARYTAVSSAKRLTLDLTCSGMSLMYARKRIGPRTEPCGTQEETGTRVDIMHYNSLFQII